MSNTVAGLILMVVTSHAELAPGEKTGLWLEEFTVPYRLFIEAGYTVEVASPTGGPTPVDPRSLEPDATGATPAIPSVLKDTIPLSRIDPARYAAVFFPGGHGTMFDLPGHSDVRRVLEAFLNSGRPTALVCHGPAALVGATGPDGTPAVKGRNVTGFTNEEEVAVQLDGKMPFLLETRLKELGARFSGGPKFDSHVVVDGALITGQNPPSSGPAAHALIQQLNKRP